MIDEVDDALRRLIKRDVLNGSDIEIVFDAPTKDWAARRNAPTIDVYLYDIREDVGRRSAGQVDVRNKDGLISARHAPPRYFKFSYLVTAWTQRPEDEHRLLSAVLRCFLRFETMPPELVSGTLAEQGYPIAVRIALPPPQDRSVSDVWSALGGELKPSLDLVTLIAVDARGLEPVAPLVTEAPIIGISGGNGQSEKALSGGRGRTAASGEAGAGGEKQSGKGGRGRSERGREGSGDAALVGRDEEAQAALVAAVAVKAAQEAEKAAAEAKKAAERAAATPDETVAPGGPGKPGRIIRIRAMPDR